MRFERLHARSQRTHLSLVVLQSKRAFEVQISNATRHSSLAAALTHALLVHHLLTHHRLLQLAALLYDRARLERLLLLPAPMPLPSYPLRMSLNDIVNPHLCTLLASSFSAFWGSLAGRVCGKESVWQGFWELC